VTDRPTIWNALLGAEVVYRDAGGIRTRCIELGSGPTLYLLHGTGGHAEAWALNLVELSTRFHVVAFDFVGHGLSAKPQNLDYVITDYTHHVRALMAAMGVERAHFAGLSLGAWVASWLALETPEAVNRLVNCTGGVFRWPEGQQQRESSERIAMAKANDDLADLTAATVRRRLHSLFHDPSLCPEELVDLRLRLYSQPDARALLPRLHHMVPYDSPARARFALTEDRLRSLSVPVLYLWGEHNPGGSVSSAVRAAELTPQAELVVVDGAGHWPQWERPADFAEHVIKFLDSYPVAGS
jgi:pimeloyl-ACP methyl ester carboxylesterase